MCAPELRRQQAPSRRGRKAPLDQESGRCCAEPATGCCRSEADQCRLHQGLAWTTSQKQQHQLLLLQLPAIGPSCARGKLEAASKATSDGQTRANIWAQSRVVAPVARRRAQPLPVRRFLSSYSSPLVSVVFATLLFQFALSQLLVQSLERSQLQPSFQHPQRPRQNQQQLQLSPFQPLAQFHSAEPPLLGPEPSGADPLQAAAAGQDSATATTSGERVESEFAPKASGK